VDTAPGVSGAGETVAILGAGDPPSLTDLAGFVKTYSLADYSTHYTQVLVGGPTRETTSEASQEQVEDTLDAEMVLGVAPNAGIIHAIVASNAGGLFEDGIAFVVNQIPQAHAVSVSFGSCERGAGFSVEQMNDLFVQASMMGQTWFFSSGDNGTDGCQDMAATSVLAVDWPASSPYVIGVGGTQFDTKGVETAWTDGGGGQSELFPKPTWQTGVGPYPNDNARDVPDVAALAGDPGANIYAEAQIQPVQGTSAAAPMWASMWSMIAESRGHVGIVNFHERLYGIGGTSAYHDIIGGNNGSVIAGYDAIAGYDLATGWGSPNLTQLVGALNK
jgi:kumamolisin